MTRSAICNQLAWLSLDENDSDPTRFWAYFIAALRTIHDDVGEAALAMLQSPQPPSIEPLLIDLINEIAEIPHPLALVLDDYHVITARSIHDALAFLLEHVPSNMHLVIATRADPPLPLARLRARGDDQVPILHQRASAWFEEEGFTEETIAHAFAARDYERVARLVEKYARDMLHQSKYNILASWLEALPQELVQTRPWLCVYQSWTRHWAGMREGGEECLENAEQMLNRSPLLSEEEKRILPGYIATVRAHYALTLSRSKFALAGPQSSGQTADCGPLGA